MRYECGVNWVAEQTIHNCTCWARGDDDPGGKSEDRFKQQQHIAWGFPRPRLQGTSSAQHAQLVMPSTHCSASGSWSAASARAPRPAGGSAHQQHAGQGTFIRCLLSSGHTRLTLAGLPQPWIASCMPSGCKSTWGIHARQPAPRLKLTNQLHADTVKLHAGGGDIIHGKMQPPDLHFVDALKLNALHWGQLHNAIQLQGHCHRLQRTYRSLPFVKQ